MKITIDGTPLILPADTRIEWTSESSAFSYDVVADAVSIGLTMPATPNAELIKHAQRVGVVDRMSMYACQIEDQGVVIPDARILIEQADTIGNRSDISFSLILTGIGASILDRKLSDYDLGTISIGPVADIPANIKALSNEAQGRVRFPTYWNMKQYDRKNVSFGYQHPDLIGLINRYEGTAYEDNPGTFEGSSFNAICPWPNLYYVLNQIFLSIGYTMEGSFWNLPEAKEILLQSDRTLDRLNAKWAFTVGLDAEFDVINTGTGNAIAFDTELHDDDSVYDLGANTFLFPDQQHLIFYAQGEYFLETTGTVNSPTLRFWMREESADIPFEFAETQSLNTGQWIPFAASGKYIMQAGDELNTYEISAVSVFTGGGTIDTMKVRNLEYTISSKGFNQINRYEKEIIVNQHVPQVAVKDLLLELRKMGVDVVPDPFSKSITFNLPTDAMDASTITDLPGYLDEHSVEFVPSKSYVLQSSLAADSESVLPASRVIETDLIDSLPGISMEGIYVLETSTKKVWRSTGAIIDDPFAAAYEFVQYYLPPLTIGEGEEEELNPSVELMPMGNFDINALTGDSDPEYLWYIPVLDEKGSSPAYANGIQEFTKIRMAIWRGFYDDGHRTYPLATSFNVDRNGDAIGSLSLDIADPVYGISRFQNKLLEKLVNEERVTIPCLLSPSQAKALKKDRPYYWKGKKLAIRSMPYVLDGKGHHIHEIEFTLL